MYGLTRGLTTLTGIGVAGFLLWLATQLDADVNADYWAQIGLVAAAGFTIALSQLVGGWTKWGWPRLTVGVLVLGFVPALVVGGLVLLEGQPDDGAFGTGWADTLGVEEIAEDLTGVVLAIAFGLGLALGLTFDTTGPRVRTAEEGDGYERGYGQPIASHDAEAADEPTMAERRTVGAGNGDRDRERDEVVERDETADREEEYTVAGEDRQPRRRLFRR